MNAVGILRKAIAAIAVATTLYLCMFSSPGLTRAEASAGCSTVRTTTRAYN